MTLFMVVINSLCYHLCWIRVNKPALFEIMWDKLLYQFFKVNLGWFVNTDLPVISVHDGSLYWLMMIKHWQHDAMESTSVAVVVYHQAGGQTSIEAIETCIFII